MTTDQMPAIRRDFSRTDAEATIVSVVDDDTSFERGLGSHGTVIQHVEYECPCCEHDEMIRSVDRTIDRPDGVAYWCLNPTCQYFVNDALSHATKPHPQMEPDTPEVWQNTARCPECDSRHTVIVHRNSGFHSYMTDGDDDIVHTVCEECMADAGSSGVSA